MNSGIFLILLDLILLGDLVTQLLPAFGSYFSTFKLLLVHRMLINALTVKPT